MRFLLAFALLALAAFCAFGVLATFEPPGSVGLRGGYGVGCAACLFGVWKALAASDED
jgi:hypothetical protein